MTVDATSPYVSYVYSGVGNYDFNFVIFEDSDLVVRHITEAGAQTYLRCGLDYVVTTIGTATANSGYITVSAALGAGQLDLWRSLPITQEDVWKNNTGLDMAVLEAAFDRQVMILQQQQLVVDGTLVSTNWRGEWVTSVTYSVGDLVTVGLNIYLARLSHTSSVFVTDLASGNWLLAFDIQTIKTSLEASAASSAASSAAAALSKTAAAASEDAAATSKVAAASSAGASSVSAGASETSKLASASSAVASEASRVASASSAAAALTYKNDCNTILGQVNTAGTTQVAAVNTAGTTQVAAVNTAGTTQVGAVNATGLAQENLSKAQVVLATAQADRAEGYADTIGVTPYVASSVMANWDTALSLITASTLNFDTVLYTGNGTSQSITTGINSCDFTVSGNGSGYWLDRTVNQVKTDAGVAVASGTANWGNSAKGVSKVHIKCRSAVYSNHVADGLRGAGKDIYTDLTLAESPNNSVSGFTPTGFNLLANAGVNFSGASYVAYQELFTHIKWGTTNHSKFFIEAYNPITGGGMIYYVGSGTTGHQIPHSQGVRLDYSEIKSLSSVIDWLSILYNTSLYMTLNTTAATLPTPHTSNSGSIVFNGLGGQYNTAGLSYISYYKRKSAQWTIKQYIGTAASQTIELGFKPSRIIIKQISDTGDWNVYDNKRTLNLSAGGTQRISLNLSAAEFVFSAGGLIFTTTGITIAGGIADNTSGKTYIILAEADTNSNGGGAYYDRPTDGLLNVNGGYFSYTNGLTDKGYDASIRTVTKSIDPTGQADGFKWVSENSDGTVSYYSTEPSYSWSTTGIAFKLEDGKWYNNNTLMSPAPSFLPKPVFLAGGKAQYLGDGELATNVMPRTAFPNGVDFTGDGWGYEDPDAIGANPVAKMYPDGTIVGSTVNGSYVKYPNGELIQEQQSDTVYTTTQLVGGIYVNNGESFSFPVQFVDPPTCAPTNKHGGTTYVAISSYTFDVTVKGIKVGIASGRENATGRPGYIAIGRWK